MKIVVVGSGYVGLVSGVCFAELGFDVTCVDNNEEKIAILNRGEVPIYEPGLRSLMERSISAGRLHFTTDLAKATATTDIVIIAVGTPPRPDDGQADMRFVYDAAAEIGRAIKKPTIVITKSTVPVGTGDAVHEIIAKQNPAASFEVVSNPEFLREGSAIEDFMKPSRLIIGVESEHAKDVMTKLYRPLGDVKLVFTDIKTAEITKYAANCFLAMKIGFINEISDLCEKMGANVQDVSRGIGLDPRIGSMFLQPGPGFGGSCFPKDTMALIKIAQGSGAPISIIEAVMTSNVTRKHRMAKKVMGALGGKVKGKTIAVLGVTFKSNTDDMRESPALIIVPDLIESGASLRIFDPQGMKEAKHMLKGDIAWCTDAYDAMKGADAVVLLTEWNEFKSLDLKKAKSVLKQPLMIDLRNLYNPTDMGKAGLRYVSLGRNEVNPATTKSLQTAV